MKIKWLEYNEETLKLAEEQGKPLLLYIHATWCHWCHVTDEQLFEDKGVAKHVNKEYIPVLVDADERGDLYKKFGQGGLPSFEFLYPNGVPLVGFSGFMPVDQFMKVLTDVKEKSLEFAPKHVHLERDVVVPRVELHELPKEIDSRFSKAFDPFHGGFGTGAKFPEGQTIGYAAERFEATKKPFWKEYVYKTVDGMVNGLWDDKAGGFYRYGVSADWTQPHTEKLLKVNAEIGLGLIEAARVFEEKTKWFHELVEKTITFIDKTLWNEDVGAYGFSKDADSDSVNKVVLLPANVLMVEFLLRAGEALEKKSYIEQAKNVSKILEVHFDEKLGWPHVITEKPEYIEWLDDQVAGLRLAVLLGDEVSALNKKRVQSWKLIEEKYWHPIMLAAGEHPGDEYFDPAVNLELLKTLVDWKGSKGMRTEVKGLIAFLGTRMSARLLSEQGPYAGILREVPETYLGDAFDISFVTRLHESLKITISCKEGAPELKELKRWAELKNIKLEHKTSRKKDVEIEACIGSACSGKMTGLGELIGFIQFTSQG